MHKFLSSIIFRRCMSSSGMGDIAAEYQAVARIPGPVNAFITSSSNGESDQKGVPKTHLVQVTWSQRDLVRMERTSTQKSYVLKSDQHKLLEKVHLGVGVDNTNEYVDYWLIDWLAVSVLVDWLIDWLFLDWSIDWLIDWLSLWINDHPVSLPGKPPRIPAMDPSKQFWPNSNRRKVTRRRKQSKFTVRWGKLRPMIWPHRRDTANFTLTVGWSTRARQIFVRLFFQFRKLPFRRIWRFSSGSVRR